MEEKNLHMKIKATVRGIFMRRIRHPEAPPFLHGPKDSMQLWIPFWRIYRWRLRTGLTLLLFYRWFPVLMLRTRAMHQAPMPKKIERLWHRIPLYLSVCRTLFHLWNSFIFTWGQMILFVVGWGPPFVIYYDYGFVYLIGFWALFGVLIASCGLLSLWLLF